jgi:hypothetical protein
VFANANRQVGHQKGTKLGRFLNKECKRRAKERLAQLAAARAQAHGALAQKRQEVAEAVAEAQQAQQQQEEAEENEALALRCEEKAQELAAAAEAATKEALALHDEPGKKQTQLTNFFAPLSGAVAQAAGACLMRGSRGPCHPSAQSQREKALAEAKQNRKAAKQQVEQLRADQATALQRAATLRRQAKPAAAATAAGGEEQQAAGGEEQQEAGGEEAALVPAQQEAGGEQAALVPAQQETALAPAKRKRGRPKGSGARAVPEHLKNLPLTGKGSTKNKRLLKEAMRRAGLANQLAPPPVELQALCDVLGEKREKAGLAGESHRHFWLRMEAETGFSYVQLKKWCGEGEKERRKRWLKQKRSKSSPASKPDQKVGRPAHGPKFQSVDTGCRIGKDGQKKKTNTDHFAEINSCLALWAKEQRKTRDLGPEDLLLEFEDRVAEEPLLLLLRQPPPWLNAAPLGVTAERGCRAEEKERGKGEDRGGRRRRRAERRKEEETQQP